MSRWRAVLQVGVLVGVCLPACGSSKPGNSRPGGGGGAADDAGAAGAPAAPASAGGGGEGDAGDAWEHDVPLETIGDVVCDTFSTAFDDENAYYSCRELTMGDYSTPQESFALRELRVGEATPTLLATSERPLSWLASDTDWHYVREYLGDELSSGSNIHRVQRGSTELSAFVKGRDQSPELLLQTDEHVIIVQSSFATSKGQLSTIEVYDKADASHVVLASLLDGEVKTAWVDDAELRWVLTPLNAAPTVQGAPLSGGPVTTYGELPALCEGFVHYGANELVAFCGPENDLARVSLDGEATVLAQSATTTKSAGLYVRDRVYWTAGGYSAAGASSLRAIDSDGNEASLELSSLHLSGVATHHAYLTSSADDLLRLRRFALMALK